MSCCSASLLAFPQDDWTSLALVRWGQPFREADPYFEYDLGFWTYWLPFETSLHVWALIALLAATTVVVFLYALTPSLRWERGTLHVSGYVRRHLSLLGALLIFLLAWSYRLDGLGLAHQRARALAVRSRRRTGRSACRRTSCSRSRRRAAAVLVGWAAWTGQMRIAFVAVTAVLALSLGLRQFLPPLAQRLADPVEPELRESGYLAHARWLHAAGVRGRSRRRGRQERHRASRCRRFANRCQSLSQWDAGAIKRAVERRRQGVVSGAIGWASDSARLIAVARTAADRRRCGRPVHAVDGHTRARVVGRRARRHRRLDAVAASRKAVRFPRRSSTTRPRASRRVRSRRRRRRAGDLALAVARRTRVGSAEPAAHVQRRRCARAAHDAAPRRA